MWALERWFEPSFLIYVILGLLGSDDTLHSSHNVRKHTQGCKVFSCRQQRFWSDCGDMHVPTVWSESLLYVPTVWSESLLSAWKNFASPQSDQNLCCRHEKTLHPWVCKMHSVKILIRLCKCAGWSESLLGAHIQRYVFWYCGYVFICMCLLCVQQVGKGGMFVFLFSGQSFIFPLTLLCFSLNFHLLALLSLVSLSLGDAQNDPKLLMCGQTRPRQVVK